MMSGWLGEKKTGGSDPCCEKAWRGFTLIELLVVVALIALLAALLVPVLRTGREAGRRAACMGRLRQLQIAWQTYAESHDGFIVCGVPVSWQEHPEGKAWLIDAPADGTPQSRAQAEAWMRTGALASYLGNAKVHRCPSQYKLDPRPAPSPKPMYLEWLSPYGIVSSMNFFTASLRVRYEADFIKHHGPSRTPACITRLSQLNPPGASHRMVFLDTGCPSLASGPFDLDITGVNVTTQRGWTIGVYGAPIHHSQGTCMSFADGHVEYWKWKDPRTLAWSQAWRDWLGSAGNGPKPESPPFPPDPDNQDYVEFYEAVWGRR